MLFRLKQQRQEKAAFIVACDIKRTNRHVQNQSTNKQPILYFGKYMFIEDIFF